MTASDPIVEKIKKLLRMKRGGMPEEIATALRLAQELADKHGVHLDDVNPDDDAPKSETMGHSVPIAAARMQCECQYAGLICQQFFHVAVFTNTTHGHWSKGGWPRRVYRYELTFVGTDWDREIATYVFNFLLKHFRREWNTNSGRCRNRQSFMWGMFLGIRSKLRERQPAVEPESTQAIMVRDRQVARRDYIVKHFGELKSESCAPDTDAQAALNRGWQAGRNTEINPALKNDGKEILQIT